MPKNETAESAVLRRRITAAWRTRACSASLCVGAQVFLLGSGVAMPLCLSSAWLAALAALPACAAAVWACHRALLQGAENAGGAEPLPYRADIHLNAQPHGAARTGGAEPLPCRADIHLNAQPHGAARAGGAEPLPYRADIHLNAQPHGAARTGGAEPCPCRADIHLNAQPHGAARTGGAEPLPYRARYVLLALTLTAGAVLALAALVSLAEQSLLTQARTLFSAGAAVVAALLCALSRGTGVSRLCFALRWALPAAVALLAAVSIPLGTPAGLFPILGAGAPALALACACMLPAALPVLMLLLPPPELETIGHAQSTEYIPDAGFFLRRILPGAAFGCALLFALSFCSTYESLAAQHTWGQRLRILSSGQPREGVAQALLSVCQMLALLLLAANMLCTAEQALLRAQPKLARMRAGLLLPAALLALCLLALIFFGMDKALLIAPWLTLPGALCLLPRRGRGKGA